MLKKKNDEKRRFHSSRRNEIKMDATHMLKILWSFGVLIFQGMNYFKMFLRNCNYKFLFSVYFYINLPPGVNKMVKRTL